MTETTNSAAQPGLPPGLLVFLNLPDQHVSAVRMEELLEQHGLSDMIALPTTLSPDFADALDLISPDEFMTFLWTVMISAGAVLAGRTGSTNVFVVPASSRATAEAVEHIVTELTTPGPDPFVLVQPLTGVPATSIDPAQVPDDLAGYLVLPAISRVPHKRDWLTTTLAGLQLTDQVTVPDTMSPHAAFRIACQPTSNKYAYPHDTGQKYTLDIELVHQSYEITIARCVYRRPNTTDAMLASIWLTSTDPSRPIFVHSVQWDKVGEQIPPAVDLESAQDLIDEITHTYYAALKCCPPEALGTIVDQILTAAGATKLVPSLNNPASSVSLIPASGADALARAVRLVAAVTGHEPATHICCVPVLAESQLATLVTSVITTARGAS